jgi:hypothetical protein
LRLEGLAAFEKVIMGTRPSRFFAMDPNSSKATIFVSLAVIFLPRAECRAEHRAKGPVNGRKAFEE